MPKSRTKVEKQLKEKTAKDVLETAKVASRNKKWFDAAKILSGPRRNRIEINLGEINSKVKDGERVAILGKVLSQGEINKKFEIIALGFSEKAKEKLLKNNCRMVLLYDEIKKNPDAREVKFLK